MRQNTNNGIPDATHALTHVDDNLQHVHEPVVIEHPTGIFQPHCLTEIAKLLRRYPTGGSIHVHPNHHIEVLVGAESVAAFHESLNRLRNTLCAPPLEGERSSDEMEFKFSKSLLSMRQLLALAAFAHVENASAVRFSDTPGTGYLVGVPQGRHRSIAGELEAFGFTV